MEYPNRTKGFGAFTEDALEYVITTPHPPRDWLNFFWNETYLASTAQNMNGSSLYQNEEGVLTNLFGKQDMREDPRWLYLRDRDSGEIWSAGYLPRLTEHDRFECRHGLGYTTLTSEAHGIELSFRVFVPREWSGEVWTVTLRNRSGRPRRLSLFTVANIMLDGVNMPYGYIGGLSASYEPEDNWLFFRNSTFTVVDEKYRAFMYADVPVDHWDVSKEHFLGKTRSYHAPERILDGRLGDSVASAEYQVGAMQHELELEPDAEQRFNFVLGVVHGREDARQMKAALGDSAAIDAEFEALKAAHIERLGGLVLRTPDGDFNRLFSVWLKHELYLMADWARFYFKGYRDTCQDAAGMSIINPGRAIEMFKRALRNQRSDGFCPRAFRVASMDIAAADKHYADSPSWISHALDAILCETGDLGLLDELVPYSDTGEGTVWEHALRAMEFLWNDRGADGLSLVHYGDWNDLMDKVGVKGKGQGVWMSMALARVLKLTGKIAGWKGDEETAGTCEARHAELRQTILEKGWDGDHFIYSINDDGMKIGTREAAEGKIFINPQSWSLLGGIVDAEAYTRIAEGIEPHVDTEVGPVHNWPAFTEYHPGIGQLSGTPPGFFTNGNVYCHAAGFKVAADFDAGRADKAFDTFMRILPAEEKSEPYAQANGYVGPTALRMKHHRSDDPWRTGTVAWNFLNCVDRLLGFRRALEGFHLRPLIPSHWDELSYDRPFRGTVFRIEIRRGEEPGILLNGRPVEDDFIAVPKDGLGRDEAHVVCTLPVLREVLETGRREP